MPEIHLWTPEIRLSCAHTMCGGERTFRYSGGQTQFYTKLTLETFLEYTCANCNSTKKRFSIHARRQAEGSEGTCYKFGELPPFGPPTPTRLLRLLGGDQELFLSGRRCENQGLGIGAFTYYRRVVENRKNDIVDEIIKVSRALQVSDEILKQLEEAKTEVSFANAVRKIQDAIPQTLFINGQNPLTLLHAALSIGVHQETDEECLERAHDTRLVLIELAEKVSEALKDEAELSAAVGRLVSRVARSRSKQTKPD